MRPAGSEPVVLVNHLGYSTGAGLTAIVVVPARTPVGPVRLVAAGPSGGHTPVAAVDAGPGSRVAGWGDAAYHRADFGRSVDLGDYRVEAEVGGVRVRSERFTVAEHRTQSMTVADITAYFRSARSSGEIDRKDRRARFYGDDSGREVDARGGWLDASGDYSKFLSHLTYTRMMSPQQIPLCAWAMMAAADELRTVHPGYRTSQLSRLRDEGLFGADFLVRFQAPEGYFYTAIFDALTKDLDERVITAPLQDSVRTTRWQAAYRHGGGMAIAALARASTLDDRGEFTADDYLAAAVRGFDHLEEHNAEYLFDGSESVIDDYCALMAATELVRATGQAVGRPAGERRSVYEAAARRRAANLIARLRLDQAGAAYLEGDHEGTPYFHAAESGLPIVALLRFAEVLPGDGLAHDAADAALTLLQGVVSRVDAVANPFGYLRQRVQPAGGEPREAFFYPHENETGYWWQGENANISSVAYAALLGSRNAACSSELQGRLTRLAEDLLAWVTGMNPFDSCMLQGRGRNNLEYSGVYQNSPGGIVNGITSGFEDEDGIDFLPDSRAADGNEWRWAEQWIPHSAWFLVAVCASA
jgi:hypothetical protein